MLVPKWGRGRWLIPDKSEVRQSRFQLRTPWRKTGVKTGRGVIPHGSTGKTREEKPIIAVANRKNPHNNVTDVAVVFPG